MPRVCYKLPIWTYQGLIQETLVGARAALTRPYDRGHRHWPHTDHNYIPFESPLHDMDEFVEGSHTLHSRLRARKPSFHSQTSAQTVPVTWPQRATTPVLRHRPSAVSIFSDISDTDQSEILAPIPRRHHILQTSESQHWLGTPPLSPRSRPTSPLANAPASPSRKRLKQAISFSSLGIHDSLRPPSTSHLGPPAQKERRSEDDNGMARRLLRWMHHENMKSWAVPSLVLASVWVKWAVGLGSYSGQGTPPMYGDYEAQRHWMELTIHLPIRQWYTYDLQYWGLDYPPLTAYVSWLCGVLGAWIDPSWVALDKSRGIETPGSKVFMRFTVLAFDLLVCVPALVMFARVWQGTRSSRRQELALAILLFQPALLLIDSGHFQYNSVMLGLTLLAVDFFAIERDLVGAVFFVLSLGFKQMALYYAPAIGAYLLAKCLYLGPTAGTKLFVRLALVTFASFVVLFLPFLPPFAPLTAILDPVTRIFPFNRGLFEDKVANFWCATNVVLKWRFWATQGVLVKLSAALTALGFLPAVLTLLLSAYKLHAQSAVHADKTKPSSPTPLLPLLPYALLTSSLSFFLFSFQVHEKTILVPLLPMTLLLSGASPSEQTFELGMLMNNVAVFSMWPLLKRDGLGVQYVALLILWNKLIGYNPFKSNRRSVLQLLSAVVYLACITLHVAEVLFSPPARLPDLFPVLNVLVSTPVFALVWLWSIKRGVEVSWALGGLGSRAHAQPRFPPKSAPFPAELGGGVGDGEARANGLPSIRAQGLRTMSLGVASGRRRTVPRSGSVDLQ
ncbi:ALG6, ALG8 glycosyltransferase family-domain-containing protein [Trametes elegans]|nr:ALG6, ALG8 glycosyltransferase family-domain-containing protein [Trametes elegans]